MLRSDDGPVVVRILTCADSLSARLTSAHRQLENAAEHHRIEVVEGFVPGDVGLDALYDADRNRRAMNRPLAAREIAVYGTHRKAWTAIRDGSAPAGLVLEDDFAVVNATAFADALRQAGDLTRGCDIVKLFDFQKAGTNRVVARRIVGGIALVRWRYPTAGAVAYLMTRRGAAKLLGRERVYRPVDEDMKYFWELDLDVWSVVPSPVAEGSASLGGSLIDADRRAAKSRAIGDRLRGNLIRLHWKLNCRWRNARPA